VLGEAHSYAAQLAELRFVLWELLPLLRSLEPGPSSAVSSPPDLSQDFRGLEQRAADLLGALGGSDPRLRPTPILPDDPVVLTQLLERLGLPCVLAGEALIPLEPVQRHQRCDLGVLLAGQLYRYRLEAARPLPPFFQGLNHVAALTCHRAALEDPALRRQARDFLTLVGSLLASCGVNGPALHFALPQEGRLELHHRGGFWLLAYGPARRRTPDRAPLFVGLPVRGRTRKERLAMPHQVSPTENDFFMPDGQPKRGGVCMGESAQYQRLHSRSFTDAEAFLYWLDAGVIVATGRSAFHQQWRGGRDQQKGRRAARYTPRGR
jgi:hypothetical protein